MTTLIGKKAKSKKNGVKIPLYQCCKCKFPTYNRSKVCTLCLDGKKRPGTGKTLPKPKNPLRKGDRLMGRACNPKPFIGIWIFQDRARRPSEQELLGLTVKHRA